MLAPDPVPTDDDEAAVVRWFQQARDAGTLPRQPFALGPGRRVADPERFYASIAQDIDSGPSHARFRGMLEDVRTLRHIAEAQRDPEAVRAENVAALRRQLAARFPAAAFSTA